MLAYWSVTPKLLHHIKAPPHLISLYTSSTFGPPVPPVPRQGYRQGAGAELHSTGEEGSWVGDTFEGGERGGTLVRKSPVPLIRAGRHTQGREEGVVGGMYTA